MQSNPKQSNGIQKNSKEIATACSGGFFAVTLSRVSFRRDLASLFRYET